MPFKQSIGHQKADGGRIENIQGKHIGGTAPPGEEKDDVAFEQHIKSQTSANGGSVVNMSGYHIHSNYFNRHDTQEEKATPSHSASALSAAHQGLPAFDGTEKATEREQAKLDELRHLTAHEIKHILTSNLTYLCEHIDNEELLDKLKEKKAIRDVPLSLIKVEKIKYQQNRALITFLEKSGEEVHVKFIDSLLETDQRPIALKLAESLK